MKQDEVIRIIQNIIFKHVDKNQYKVFLFGSRTSNFAKEKSDFDIGILGKRELPATIHAKIEEELEASDIPFLVDIVDFTTVDKTFKQNAMENMQLWN